MSATLTIDTAAATDLGPYVHVIRWTRRSDERDYVLVGVDVGPDAGDFVDLTRVMKFDALTATVVAEFDHLVEVARSGEVPGYRIPADADWWRARWVRCQREHVEAATDLADLLDRIEEALS